MTISKITTEEKTVKPKRTPTKRTTSSTRKPASKSKVEVDLTSKFINFVKSSSGVPGNSNITSLRRESMFIEMLQGLHPLDAEIMCLVKDKNLQSKYKITKQIVGQAYSDIQWETNR
jgi:hypothetical protein